jgi:hypothetical protein
MKAITYLQKVGAIPEFDTWDLKMAAVVLTEELFCEDMVMEPDCLDWTQEVNQDHHLFNQRCNLILYGSSGNTQDLFLELLPITDTNTLQGFIRELLDLRMFYYGLHKEVRGEDVSSNSEEEWFINLYNDFVDMGSNEKFSSKSEILRFYYSGSLTEIGEKILKEKDLLKRTGKSI